MKLSRFETVWDHVVDVQHIHLDVLQEGMIKAIVRQNSFNPSVILSSFIGVELEAVPHKFLQLKSMLRGRCKSMKFYFHSDDRKDLPLSELKTLGFKQDFPHIWVHNHPDYDVSAIEINSFKEREWILQVEKRKGHGLPDHAADYGKLFDRQLKLELTEVKIS